MNYATLNAMALQFLAGTLETACKAYMAQPGAGNYTGLEKAMLLYQQGHPLLRSMLDERTGEPNNLRHKDLLNALKDAPLLQWPDLIVKAGTKGTVTNLDSLVHSAHEVARVQPKVEPKVAAFGALDVGACFKLNGRAWSKVSAARARVADSGPTFEQMIPNTSLVMPCSAAEANAHQPDNV
jgi:hypothetical protein